MDSRDVIPSPIQYWASRQPDTPALITSDREISYLELARRIGGTTAYLRGRGLSRGDLIAMQLPHSADYVITLWAIWHLGAIALPISNRLPSDAVNERLSRLQVDAIVLPSREERPGYQVFQVDEVAGRPGPSASSLPDLLLSSDATLIYTSGSSGTPKAVLHTLGNHYYSAKGSNENISLQPSDRWLLSLPLYHVGGLAILFRCALAGAAVHIQHDSSPSDALLQQVTHLSVVPTQLKRMLARKSCAQSALKAVLLGGGPISASLVGEALQGGWPLHTTYGLTEMGSQVTSTPPNSTPGDLATAGYVLSYRELKLAENQEILVRGSTRFRGYRNGDRMERPFDKNGWYATGDVGRWDDVGRLVVVGRKDHLIISGGENIQPEEIERVMQASPYVEEAVVVGVSDAEFGQRPVAFVRWRSSRQEQAELEMLLREKLAGFKVPEQFYIMPDDLSGGLKPPRKKLKEIAEHSC